MNYFKQTLSAAMSALRLTLAAAVLLTVVTACGDDNDKTANDDQQAAFTCDPTGGVAAQSALFNAPLDANVTVITKVPTHPGTPGPLQLP